MARLKVLITGASGYVASLVLPALRERYETVLVDSRAEDRDGDTVDGVQAAHQVGE